MFRLFSVVPNAFDKLRGFIEGGGIGKRSQNDNNSWEMIDIFREMNDNSSQLIDNFREMNDIYREMIDNQPPTNKRGELRWKR